MNQAIKHLRQHEEMLAEIEQAKIYYLQKVGELIRLKASNDRLFCDSNLGGKVSRMPAVRAGDFIVTVNEVKRLAEEARISLPV